MANVNAPFGLKPVGSLGMGHVVSKTQWMAIPAADSTAVFLNDAVKFSAGGIALDNQYFPYVIQAAATDVPCGIVVGFGGTDGPVPAIGDAKYRLADTLRYVEVNIDPDVIFMVQADEALDVDAMHANCPIIVGSGNTATGQSAMQLNAGDEATTATDEIALIGPAPIPGNDPSAAYSIWLAKFNKHQFALGRTGVT